jgi:ribosomal protein S6
MTCTPVKPKSYPAFVSPVSKRVKFALTPSVKDKENVIYQINEASTDKSYVGKTGQVFRKRIQQHQSSINTTKDRGKTQLYQRIRENPKDFSVRVLDQATRETLDAAEAAQIKKIGSVKSGYNKNRGKGGGSCADKADKPFVPPSRSTPEKYFPLKKRSDGTVGVKFTPRSAKIERAVYVFRNEETDERYVGKTIRKVPKRLAEHLHFANHPEKEQGQKRLYKEIRENTEAFSVGILQEVPPDHSLDKSEKHFIKIKRARTHGYNGNGGGGGSS